MAVVSDLSHVHVPPALGQVTGTMLEGWGFKRSCRVFSTWSAKDLEQLAQGVKDWRSGTSQHATDKMKPLYFLSHHAMEKRYNENSCLFGLKLLSRRSKKHAENPLGCSTEQQIEESADESDDELPLVGHEFGDV